MAPADPSPPTPHPAWPDPQEPVEQELVLRRLRASSVYKLLLIGLLASLLPLGLLLGLSGMLGADTVKWNQQQVHGLAALLTSGAMAVMVALLFTGLLGTLACLGLWLYTRFRPLRIRGVLEPPGGP